MIGVLGYYQRPKKDTCDQDEQTGENFLVRCAATTEKRTSEYGNLLLVCYYLSVRDHQCIGVLWNPLAAVAAGLRSLFSLIRIQPNQPRVSRYTRPRATEHRPRHRRTKLHIYMRHGMRWNPEEAGTAHAASLLARRG